MQDRKLQTDGNNNAIQAGGSIATETLTVQSPFTTETQTTLIIPKTAVELSLKTTAPIAISTTPSTSSFTLTPEDGILTIPVLETPSITITPSEEATINFFFVTI